MNQLAGTERAELYSPAGFDSGLPQPGMRNGLAAVLHWYAIHTRSNFEKRVAAELETKGISGYLPAYQEVHQWTDRKRKVDVPLFPGYLFARFQEDPESRLAVLKTAGIVRILGRAGAIEPVPESQIEAVRKILNSRIPCFAHPMLRAGSRVRVVRGALCGLEGTLARSKKQARLVVSIPLLNQSVSVEVGASDVEPALARG